MRTSNGGTRWAEWASTAQPLNDVEMRPGDTASWWMVGDSTTIAP